MYLKKLTLTIISLALLIVSSARISLAEGEAASSLPPDLEFIYHDEWWGGNSFSTAAAKYRTVAGDFNGDGRGDIAMLHRTNSSTMRFYVMFGAGDHFDWQGIWLVVDMENDLLNADMVTGRVVAGDFNNDGFDDIAVFAEELNTILYVFMSNGSNQFSYQSWWYGDASYAAQITGRVVAGDFDGDGWVDDIVALYDVTGEAGDDDIRADVFLSNGLGFAAPVTWWSRGGFIPDNAKYRTVAGDLDADGDDDVVMVYKVGTAETDVNVLLSSGSGFDYKARWWESVTYIADRTTGRVAAGDFDGDGDDDVALLYDYFEPGPPEKNITRGHVLLSTRQAFSYQGSVPGWWEHTAYVANYVTGLVVAGDWNGNGVDDVSMIYPGSDPEARAQVLEATAPSPQLPAIRQVDGDDPGCNDASGAPFCTIQAAVDSASDGDNIQVAAGGYFEHISAPKYGDPGFNQTLTIQGADADGTFVDGSNGGIVFTIQPGGDITLSNLTIQNGGSDEGGVFVRGTLNLVDSVIRNNHAAGYGGGVFNDQGTVKLLYSVVESNDAGLYGGGIYNLAGTLIVTSSSLSENVAYEAGGGIHNDEGGVVTVDSSTIEGNYAMTGGGIANAQGGALTVTNSTLSGNINGIGGNGGGIITADSTVLILANSTVSGNTGKGIANNGALTVTNSIVSNNSGGDCSGLGSWITAGSPNMDSDSSCPGFTLTGDPLLGPLEDNGGATQTHAPFEGSPAIDVGSNPACPANDQRGVSRPRDGNGDGSAICDLGAVEVYGPELFLPLLIRNP